MIVVYTSILGGSDSLKAAPSGASRCVCFVDDPAIYMGQTRGWELVPWKYEGDARREAWHLRCIPHVLFPEATKTIWLDASFTLTDLPKLLFDSSGYGVSAMRHHQRNTCYEEGREILRLGQAEPEDVMRQLGGYEDEGFKPSKLTISCTLVRENSPAVNAFNERWDSEIRNNRGDNTQLSSDYSAWKSGIQIHHLEGSFRKHNPYASHDHADHKRRRVPYDTHTAVRRS